MTTPNPFATAPAAPSNPAPSALPNPFGAAQQAQAPVTTPPQAAPQFQAPPQTQAAPIPQATPTATDPFADTPDAPPAVDRLTKDDITAQATAVVLYIVRAEQFQPTYPGATPGKMDTRLVVNCGVVTGPKKGSQYQDMWITWSSVVRQFSESAGNGKPYLVELYADGRAIKARSVSDPNVRAQASSMLG